MAGQIIFIRTWQGEGHKVLPRGVDFATNDSPTVFFDGEPIVGDAIIHPALLLTTAYRPLPLIRGERAVVGFGELAGEDAVGPGHDLRVL